MNANSFPDLHPNPDKPFSQEGYALVGAAIEVHRTIGGGLLEEVYQECLELELSRRGIPFARRPELAVFYKGSELRKRYIPDLYVHDGIVVELKATSEIIPEHEAQLINYMRIARKSVGYLLNFAPVEGVEWKRMVITDFASRARPRISGNS
ncbi:GxxExxY protein [Verrucomicrobium sp. BvORR034]|uniref:GxxExxY protein n=1 Tax=Verrucomicrobium sp. BvORR034 TaxID=1396418 RepID=UPI00067872DE|nr:GxxExxY protein [Verrucomicrobium sp. BvORR034]